MDAETSLNFIDAATYANASVQRIFGAEFAGIIGWDDSHFFDLEQSNALRQNDAEVIAQGTSIAREQRDIIKESGEEKERLVASRRQSCCPSRLARPASGRSGTWPPASPE